MSSILGCVAAVIAIVSPSQPRPAVTQSIWISFMAVGVESGTGLCSGELGIRFPFWNANLSVSPQLGKPREKAASSGLYPNDGDVSGFLLARRGCIGRYR